MASVSADPLRAIAYRTGIQTFTGTISAPTFGSYEFSDVNDFSESIVRFKEITVAYQQSLTKHTYTLKSSGDPGYDPANPSSYISRTATASINYTYKLVHTDTNYLADLGTNDTITAAPFRQRDNRSFIRFPWEYDNYTDAGIQSLGLDVGDWSVTQFNSDGSTATSDTGDVYPTTSGLGQFSFRPEYTTNKWYLEATNGPTLSTFLIPTSPVFGRIQPGELEFGAASDFESSARTVMPSISGSSIIDFFVGVPSGSFPSDEDFASGPPKIRFTQSTTITPSYTTYSL